MIKLCLVEDNDDIRNSWKELFSLSESIECVADFRTGEGFLNALDKLDFDVVLVDIALPGIDGIECVRTAKGRMPQKQFLMCTIYEEDDKLFDSICAGATGYLLKSASFEEMEKAVVDIANGGSPMTGSIARKVITSFCDKPTAEVAYKLTARENQILTLLSRGQRYKEIAAQLSLSVETVRTHIRNIYEKLQVDSRTDALNIAFPTKSRKR